MSALSPDWIEVSRSVDRKTAEDHVFVLEALGIPAATTRMGIDHVVIVPLGQGTRAVSEIAKFSRENQGWPLREPPVTPITDGVWGAAVYAVLLAAALHHVRRGFSGIDWANIGCADASLIRAGVWWRSLTALTLHADALHLAGNLAFGALFGVMLAQSVGSGLAWLSFVITGALGNLANAWIQSPAHASIGASTGVFGVLGVLVAHDWMRRRHVRHSRLRRAAPIVLGIVLLAWLGGFERDTGEATTAIRTIDVWAHVLGFAAGIGAGLVLGRTSPDRYARKAAVQAATAFGAVALVAYAWFLALR